MTLDRIIEGVPLSVKKIIEGVVVSEYDIKNFSEDSIVLTKIDNPKLVIYFGKVKGFITYNKMLLNHFLIVAREFGVPVYYVNKRVRTGERIMVIPENRKIDISMKTIRFYGYKTAYNVYSSIKRMLFLLDVLGRDVKYSIEIKKGMVYFRLYITDIDKLEKEIEKDPNKYITLLKLWRDWMPEAGVIAQTLGEIVYDILYKYTEISNIGYLPYWLKMSEEYSLLRFGRDYSNILKNVEIRREKTNIPEDLKDLFKLYKECVVTYELKDKYLYEKKKD